MQPRFLKKLALAGFATMAALPGSQAAVAQLHDVIIRNGAIYDGTGADPIIGDVAIDGDTIAEVGPQLKARGKTELNAERLAVSPGFINMLSWATETLLVDGRSESDIRQGVTLEIFGEGISMGPLNEAMKKELHDQQGDLKFEVAWTTLDEYLRDLVNRGVSPNVASFVGATTVRIHELGYADRAPTAAELQRMEGVVDQAMREGALGVGSALIYAPAFYARPPELIALASVASRYGGMYVSHMRSEGSQLLESIDELIELARTARIPAEIYHFKAAGPMNWSKLDRAVVKIEGARSSGLRITADMYAYAAAATGLDAAMPPWVQEGGYVAWAERMEGPCSSRSGQTRDEQAHRFLGELLRRRRLAGKHSPGRFQE